MERTRKSLFYVVFYLLLVGLALLLAPDTALGLFGSDGDYHEAPVRFVGVLLLTLGFVVLQLVRLRSEPMYGATLAARTLILPGLAGLYLAYGNPFFAILCGIVGLGYTLTWACFLLDRRDLT